MSGSQHGHDPKANPNADIVSSIEALGEHIDSIARAVANMKVQMNGRKLVGEIINDVDEGLGKIAYSAVMSETSVIAIGGAVSSHWPKTTTYVTFTKGWHSAIAIGRWK